ncbi:restriction endonuclease [Streptomyces sp. NPDC101776]|uniref:restriction endonuclease n=1 Tax=Streptomyces sp. NPDC101776 TaxID=3366146 RepID=UPI00381B4343
MLEEMPYDDMTDVEFEEFCFALLEELGFVNVDWRKGTGFNASPSDRGRDIVAERQIEEFDGSHYVEKWFIDCKHYKQGVPPEKVSGLLSWVSAERADVALVIASNHLSNPCKDYLNAYQLNNRPPFRIKHWERPNLRKLIEGRGEFLSRIALAKQRKNDAEFQVTFALNPSRAHASRFRMAYVETYYHPLSAKLLSLFPEGITWKSSIDDGIDLNLTIRPTEQPEEEEQIAIALKPFSLGTENVDYILKRYGARRFVPLLVVAAGTPEEYADVKFIESESGGVRIVKWRGSTDDINLKTAVEASLAEIRGYLQR